MRTSAPAATALALAVTAIGASAAHAATVPFLVPDSKGVTHASSSARAQFKLLSGFMRAETVNGNVSSYEFSRTTPAGDGKICTITLRGVAKAKQRLPHIGTRTARWSGGTFRVTRSGRAGALRWAVGRDGDTPVAVASRRVPSGIKAGGRRWVSFELSLSHNASGTPQAATCQAAVDSVAKALTSAVRSMKLVKH